MVDLSNPNFVLGVALARDLENKERVLAGVQASQFSAASPVGVLLMNRTVQQTVKLESDLKETQEDRDKVRTAFSDFRTELIELLNKAGEAVAAEQPSTPAPPAGTPAPASVVLSGESKTSEVIAEVDKRMQQTRALKQSIVGWAENRTKAVDDLVHRIPALDQHKGELVEFITATTPELVAVAGTPVTGKEIDTNQLVAQFAHKAKDLMSKEMELRLTNEEATTGVKKAMDATVDAFKKSDAYTGLSGQKKQGADDALSEVKKEIVRQFTKEIGAAGG